MQASGDAMHHRLFLATAAVALSLSMTTPVRAHTEWVCGLSDDAVRLLCVAEAAPETPDAGAGAGAAPVAPVVTVNGTTFPLDPRRLYTVDLWSPPTDMAFVEQLARATICYRSPECRVVVNPGFRSVADATPRNRRR
jgi:hypothetical protein